MSADRRQERRQSISCRLACAALFTLQITLAHARQFQEAGSDAPLVPPGYEYVGNIEFTDAPNQGRPHIHLAGADDSITHPEEEWHTLLVTPDGRAYKKPVAETLEEYQPDSFEGASPFEELAEAVSRRRLAQVNQVAAPSASIGASTSGDLSCEGCGPDNRIQVTDTTVYPYMTVGRLIGQLGTSSLGLECTGTLIGNSHVLTAAHCVFDINASRKMVSNLNFAPAMSGSRTPYGTLEWTQARILSQFSSQPSYTTTAMNYDFALVTLAEAATSGYLSLYFPSSTGTADPSLTTAGYPGSMAPGTMWMSACGNTTIDYSSNNAFANVAQCTGGSCANILTHHCISSDGQSGSGMWDTNYSIRAILTGKVTVSNGDAYNVGTEIDTQVYNQIASWYNEDADTAGNGTLPLAPSGPGSQPSDGNAFVRWWNENWPKIWFKCVFIVVCVVVAGFLFIGFIQLLRCCSCCSRPSKATKTSSTSTYSSRQLPASPITYPSTGYPSHGYPSAGYPQSSYYQNGHTQYPVSAAAYR